MRGPEHPVDKPRTETQPPTEKDWREEEDDSRCWVCGAPTIRIHCKIVCPVCGFRRDCSDP